MTQIIEQLQAKVAELEAENARLRTVPMKYLRMAFNAQLQDENNELRAHLAAEQEEIQKLRQDLLTSYGESEELSGQLVKAEQIANETSWQPIETAPKDAFVLLAGPSGYTTIKTVFTTGRMCSDYHKGRWIDHANDDLTDWGFEPTHWMPLPKAPNGASS